MAKTRVGIIAVTGYAGMELARLLYHHPEVELTSVSGRSAAGQKLSDVFPHLPDSGLTVTAELEPDKVDVIFAAMPHKESAEILAPLARKGFRVIDLSADFRLKDPKLYETWYGFTHPAPDLLKEAVFGLTELYKPQIARAKLIANPGCYPTSAILALAPALREGLIQGDIIIDSKSGVSGAGRGLSLSAHFSEVNEDVSAYSLGGHRHLPEITQELALLNPKLPLKVTFVPHLIPMIRGILTTVYAPLAPGKIGAGKEGKKALLELYKDFYKNEPFVRVLGTPPHTKYTSGSNYCIIHPTADERTGRLIVVSVLDNLVKGASGQAIQNMNVMLGYPETIAVDGLGLYP
ncbi:MAG: N-acetyl-gamma-glutamyl-phosphate reductase [Chloroflexota bacterium]